MYELFLNFALRYFYRQTFALLLHLQDDVTGQIKEIKLDKSMLPGKYKWATT